MVQGLSERLFPNAILITPALNPCATGPSGLAQGIFLLSLEIRDKCPVGQLE